MTEKIDPGASLGRFYGLSRGPRVCLRLARIRDGAGIGALLAAQGKAIDEVDLARLVRSDPRCRVVVCATALVDGRDRIVGIGAMSIDDETFAPSLLVVDEELTEGLDRLLGDALFSRAESLRRRRVA